jgi:hypothetical protein
VCFYMRSVPKNRCRSMLAPRLINMPYVDFVGFEGSQNRYPLGSCSNRFLCYTAQRPSGRVERDGVSACQV